MKNFNKILIVVLMITGAFAFAMDPIKKKAEYGAVKPAPTSTATLRFCGLFCCIVEFPLDPVPTERALMRPLNRTLMKAATDGDAVEVQRALKAGAQVNAQDANGHTPLYAAIKGSCPLYPVLNLFRDYSGVVDALMNAGADVTLGNHEAHEPRIDSVFSDLKGTLPPIMIRVINGIHPNHKKNMYSSDDNRPSYLHKFLWALLDRVLDQSDSDSVATTKPLVDAILCAGFDMTVKGRPNVYQMGSRKRDAVIEQRKKMLKSTESAIFEFQKKHRAEIERVIGDSIHPDLFPLIYECLYIRPYEDGRITNYLKELLTMRLSPTFTAIDVAKRVRQITSGGGKLPSLETQQGQEMLSMAVAQGNGPLVEELKQASEDALPATAAANS